MADQKAVNLLISGRARIEQGWTQGHFLKHHYKRAHWWSTDRKKVESTSYCSVGALNGSGFASGVLQAEQFLAQAITGSTISSAFPESIVIGWNDTKGRTKEEVLAMFDKAITLAQAWEPEKKFDPIKYWPMPEPVKQFEPKPDPIQLDVERDVREFVNNLPDAKYPWYDRETNSQIRPAIKAEI